MLSSSCNCNDTYILANTAVITVANTAVIPATASNTKKK